MVVVIDFDIVIPVDMLYCYHCLLYAVNIVSLCLVADGDDGVVGDLIAATFAMIVLASLSSSLMV